MLFLYNITISIYFLLIQLFAIKSTKARLWIDGRKDILLKIERKIDKNEKYVWFHFASLGEFEQGRPVLEHFKFKHPNEQVIITFFSPSGYEIRKNYELAAHIFYLPIDTKANAQKFIRLINPKFAVFTKYEYWYHYFRELNRNQIPLYIISGIFRKKQPFFKWYGNLHREMLSFVSYFFVQNPESLDLLKSINMTNAVISGDTRFDRVAQNALNPRKLENVETFCDHKPVVVAGSTWLKDEELLIKLIENYPDWKFIIAPHETDQAHIKNLTALLRTNYILYSEYVTESRQLETINNVQTLVIDNIGMLSSLYQYADIAYIGGGFGAGIHNTLEAAAFGLPVIFGPNYYKFQEAKDLLSIGAAFTINNSEQLQSCFSELQNDINRIAASKQAKNYVETKTGATDIILKHIAADLTL